MSSLVPSIFEPIGQDQWRPHAIARGPFDGVQGGAVAGLLCASAEQVVGAGYRTLAITTHFLRPTPLELLTVTTIVVQQGRRTAVVEVGLSAADQLRARAVVTLASAVDIAAVPERVTARSDPTGLERRVRQARHGQPWLMDAMEAYTTNDGVYWFRFAAPITGTESSFARMLAPADWTPGISRPDTWEQPVVSASPNVELSVHMERHPEGDWLAVEPTARWRKSGVGVAAALLSDLAGPCGQVSTAVILVP